MKSYRTQNFFGVYMKHHERRNKQANKQTNKQERRDKYPFQVHSIYMHHIVFIVILGK